MKKIIFVFFVLINLGVYSQAPNGLNYQGVARDAVGNIISTTIGLKFEILQGSPTGTVTYAETNTSLPSSAGIFTANIGSGTVISPGTFPMINWANGPYYIQVGIDPAGGTSFSTVGVSQLLSVPYALYAATAGGSSSMPTGTLTGQTLYWNNGTNNWVVDKNVLNDGSRVVIGDFVILGNNKLKVTTVSPTDSAAIFAYHPNATANQAAIRGFASGSSANSGTFTINPIIGGHFLGYNTNNNGSAVGSVGQALSPGGDAIGVIAIASSSSTAFGRSVGLYASGTGSNYLNNYAAFFDKGKVFVNDTLIINTNGSIGDVLTRGINGKAHWQTPGAGGGPWLRANISGSDNVYLQTVGDLVNIGLPIGISANEKLHVHNITGDAFINLSTSLNSNNVGLVFGESSNISKGVLTFDNATNSLTYRLFSKRYFFMDGGSQNFFFGKIPIGAASINAMNIYDSVSSASPKPILRLINMAGSSASNPSGIYLGDDFSNGLSLAYDKLGVSHHMHIGNTNLNTFYHTFTDNGEYYPGSNGSTAGLVSIVGGSGNTSDLTFNSSSSGNRIVFNGHLRGMGPAVAISTTAVTGGFSAVTSPTCINCNDTRGVISFSTSATGFSPTNYAEVTIAFAKPYTIVPNINVTPISDVQGLSYVVSNATATGFSLRVYRSATMSMPSSIPNALFKFNYIVIE